MKYSPQRLAALLLLLTLFAAADAYALAKAPALQARVNDYAGLLDSRQRAQIEESLARYERDAGTQVALLTVESLEGEDIESFSMRVAEAWKIGRAGKDNGILLVVAKNDRKVRIEVGYGLEGSIPDAIASRIIRDTILPAFKSGNYFMGIAGGLDAIMHAASGKEPNDAKSEPGRTVGADGRSVFSLVLMAVIFLILISTRTGRFLLFASLFMGGGRGGGRGGFGGGFSGGGGSFGGGGASGSW